MKYFIDALETHTPNSGENSQKLYLIKLSDKDAKEKASLLEQLVKESEIESEEDRKSGGVRKEKHSSEALKAYQAIEGPIEVYFINSIKYDMGQILDELPKEAIKL